MNKSIRVLSLLLIVFALYTTSIYSQDNNEVIDSNSLPESALSPETIEESEVISKEKGRFNFFLNNVLLFPLSVPDGGFGLGETVVVQYTTPFNLSFGIESGYYGFKSETEIDNYYTVVGGFSIIPIFAHVSYNIRLIDGLFLTPVIKMGIGYNTAEIQGWLSDSTFAAMFEGGLRLKAFVAGGLLIQANINYTGVIEKSGLFSLISLGFGLGF